jgi:hypothetical protein
VVFSERNGLKRTRGVRFMGTCQSSTGSAALALATHV